MSGPEINMVNPAFFHNVKRPYVVHQSPPHPITPEPLPKMFAFPLGFNFNPQQQVYAFANIVEHFSQLVEPVLSRVLEEAPVKTTQPELPLPVLRNLGTLREALVNLHAQLGAGFQPQGAPPLPRELLRVLLRVPVFIRQIEHILKNVPPELLQPPAVVPQKEVAKPFPTAEKPAEQPKAPVPLKVFEEFKRTFPSFVRELTVALPNLPVKTPPVVKEAVQAYLKAPVVQVFAPSAPIIPLRPEEVPPPAVPVSVKPRRPQAAPLVPAEKIPLQQVIVPVPKAPEPPKEVLPVPPSTVPVSIKPRRPQATPLVPAEKIPLQQVAVPAPKAQEPPKEVLPVPLKLPVQVLKKPQEAPLVEVKAPLLRPAPEKPLVVIAPVLEKVKQIPTEKVQIPVLPTPLEKPQKAPVEKIPVPPLVAIFVKPEKIPTSQVSVPSVPLQELPEKPQEQVARVAPPVREAPVAKVVVPPLVPRALVPQVSVPSTPTPQVSVPSAPTPQVSIPSAPLQELPEKPQEQVARVAPPAREAPVAKVVVPPVISKTPPPEVPLPRVSEKPAEIPAARVSTPVVAAPQKAMPEKAQAPMAPPKIVVLNHPETPPRPRNLLLPVLNIPRGFPSTIPLVVGSNVMSRVENARSTPPFSTEIPFAFIVPYSASNPIHPSSSKTPLAKAKNVKEDEDEDGTGDESLQILTYIPGGETRYGDPFEEGAADERPLRVLTVKPFGIGIYPVTNEQFSDFLTDQARKQKIYLGEKGDVFTNEGVLLCRVKTGSVASDIETDPHKRFLGFKATVGRESYPVVCVTYRGAKEFCEVAGFRLPTEIEWERAASIKLDPSGKVEKKFRFGFGQDTINPSLATYQDKSSTMRALESRTTPVGFYNGKAFYTKDGRSFQSTNAVSPFGCYDMSGNVWEWTSTGDDGHKIIKGGCFNSPIKDLRASARKAKEIDSLDGFTGFRVALT